MTSHPEPIRILFVDDDEDDCEFFREALHESSVPAILRTLCEGQDLMTELSPMYNNPPDAIFLDINMPGMNGFEILEEIRTTGPFKDVPVIMLSTSAFIKDIEEAYSRGANMYIPKSVFFSVPKSILEELFSGNWKDSLTHVSRDNFVLTEKDLMKYQRGIHKVPRSSPKEPH